MKELEVPCVETQAESRRRQSVEQIDQRPRPPVEDIFQRHRQTEPVRHLQERWPEVGGPLQPKVLVKPVAPRIVTGMDNHQPGAEPRGAFQGPSNPFGRNIGHQGI